MAAIVRDKSFDSGSLSVRESFFVDVPQSDTLLFQLFANKLGWQIRSKQAIWDDYLQTSPEDADLTDEEIMEEIRAVRYGKNKDHH